MSALSMKNFMSTYLRLPLRALGRRRTVHRTTDELARPHKLLS